MRQLQNSGRNRRQSKRLCGALLALTLTCLASWSCLAEEVPVAGTKDARIKFVEYDPNDVVQIVGHFGYSTHITFSDKERVTSVVLGDTLAWEVAPAGNNLFVKPREDNARTNMTVLTNQDRVYTFYLAAAPKPPSRNEADTALYLRVTFRYPDAAKALVKRRDDGEEAKRLLATAHRDIRNIDYMECGDDDVTPDQAFDDGRFTFLRYAGARQIPAVFVVNPDGSEALVDSHMEADTLVVHRVAQRLVFRRGDSVGCIVNQAYDPRGVETLSGTVADKVVRVLKQEPQP